VAVAGRRLNFWQWFAVGTIKPVLRGWTKRTWSGMEQIPASGGVIIAANHLSEFDPMAVAHFVYDSGRWPQFLAKSSLFKIVGLGRFLSAVKQIPVYRGTTDAVKSLEAAVAALKAGAAVIVYPEGTTPKQGDLWPQRGKTGMARMFLATGVPVIPVVTWGPQNIMDPRSRKLSLRPRTPVTVVAGPAVDLSAWKDAAPTAANLYAITDQIMLVLRDMLAELRQEPAPDLPSASGKRNGSGSGSGSGSGGRT
jgi:1-acyl-sn-glycerol-3-phosphate acyltransferase